LPTLVGGDNDKVPCLPAPFGKLILAGQVLSPVRTIAVRAVLIDALLSTIRLPFSMMMTMSVAGALLVR
jgi:hypothetical protein